MAAQFPHYLRSVGYLILMTSIYGCHRPVDVNDKKNYTHVKGFDGQLNVVDGLVHADVYVLASPSDDPMDAPISQNLIELRTSKETKSFRWPDKFGAGWCEVLDLDGDGFREFVFVDQTVARVVAFRDGAFLFRPGEDEFIGQHQIRMTDSDGNGELELVSYAPPILDPKGPPGSIAFLSWRAGSGFSR